VARDIGGTAIRADVSQEADVTSLFSEILKTYGRLDILINNAGTSGPIMPIAEMDIARWDECLATNLRGAMLCMKEAARIMTNQQSGSIINMSSLMGLQGYPMRSAYTATKFALIGITQAVAREVGPSGVRVNALCPGAVSGELMDHVIAGRAKAEGKPREQIIRENYTDVAALRRWVDPEEVAEASLFLASDASSSITGESIKVDAGRF
jgi:NAD(P)-dependent dehydrogenase (short-subunit alcohol dehydrogenase family)